MNYYTNNTILKNFVELLIRKFGNKYSAILFRLNNEILYENYQKLLKNNTNNTEVKNVVEFF